jgi:hypothetical protein
MKPGALTQEEWELQQLIFESGHICSDCGEDLEILDEVFLLQVVRLGWDENNTFNHFIVMDEKGDYKYEPHFFHHTCWEGLRDSLCEIVDDLDPHTDTQPELVVAACQVCCSEIRGWEVAGLITQGELRRSQRSPNGEPTIYFSPGNNDRPLICIGCLAVLNESVIEVWEEQVRNGSECSDGRMDRCWRYSTCQQYCHRLRGVAE